MQTLPVSASPLARSIAAATAPTLGADAERLRDLWNAGTCPEELLPWLAWALSVDVWQDAWSAEEKRTTIQQSISWHRKKGTPWAVKAALAGIGFPECVLVEHRALHEAWLAAGGELLDGAGTLDGTGTLAPPAGAFRFATQSWAEYALRLNVDGQPWSAARQREIIAACKAYGPVRSRLAAIILTAIAHFEAVMKMGTFAARGHTRFADCRRFYVPQFDTLDGCDIIGGTNSPDALDGVDTLDGLGVLNGTRPEGEPLDGGQMAIVVRGRSAFNTAALGGTRQEPAECLTGGMTLDGRTTISGPILDGRSTLDGRSALSYPSLDSPDEWLDGVGYLSEHPGLPSAWFSAAARVTRGAHTYSEPLQ